MNRKRKCKWSDIDEDWVNDNTETYLNEAMEQGNQDAFLAVCDNFAALHDEGELNLLETPMLAGLI